MQNNSEHNGLIGSLFSGYGGLDLGVDMALGGGMRVAYTSDIEPGPCAIESYHAHGDDCPNLGDITGIDFGDLPDTDVVVGGSPCFPAGSLVLTDRGFTPIEQVRVGDLALTHLGNWKRVVDTGSHIGDTVILKGQGTPGIECTPNHKFRAGHRYQGPWDRENRTYPTMFMEDGWIPAADMTGRMWLNMGGHVPALPIPAFDFTGCQTRDIRLSTPFFYFVGRWLGDGWLNVFKRTGRKASYMKRVFVCDSFDKEDELRGRLDETGLHFGMTHERTTVRFCCSSTALHDWLESNFGRGAANKTIPAWAFGMKREWREALLRGYWDSDGDRTENGMHATSASKRLLLGVKMLAAGLGAPSGLGMHEPTRARCVIEGRIVNEKTNYMLTAYDHPRKSIMTELGYWGHVREIGAGREKVRVYNITVEDDHSYTIDGIAVRNCQSMSLAGLRAGMHEGTRSGLWSYQADILKASKSPLLLWENVQGALTATASSREDLAEADRRAKALEKAGLCACGTPSVNPSDGFTPPDPDAEGAKPLATVLRDYLEADPEKCAAVVCKACGRHVFEINGDTVLADGGRLDGVHTAPTIRALGRVLGDLANLGYDAVWRGLEAADIGAPHHRLRIFVTAWPRDPSTAREPSNARLKRLAQLPPMRPKGRAWAVWDADRDVWTTGEPDLFGQVDVYMDAWPKSGVMAAGRVYMVPGSWLTVPVPAAGSALATPKATDGAKGGPNQSYGNGDAPLPAQAAMLPTIKAGDAGHTGPNQRFGAGNPSLAASVAGIGVLPTPNVSDAVPADGFLYTPKRSDGVFAAPATSGRPLDRSTFLSTQVRLMDLPGRMDPEKVREHDSRLPSPRANSANGAGGHGDGAPDLRTVAVMLPTPNALYDSVKAGTAEDAVRRKARGVQLGLADEMNLL